MISIPQLWWFYCIIFGLLLTRFLVHSSTSLHLNTSLSMFHDDYRIIYNESLYNKVYAKYSGDIYIAGLFSMHHLEPNETCGGLIEQDGLQVLAAAIYGIKKVHEMKILPLKLGLLAIDTCQSPDYVIEQSKTFLQFKMSNVAFSYTCSNGGAPQPKEELESFQNVFGVFGAGNSDVSISVSSYLKLVNLPQLSFFSTSNLLSDIHKFPTFFRTIPSDGFMIKAVVKLLRKYKWNYLMVINDYSDYSQQLTTLLKKVISEDTDNSICIAEIFTIKQRSGKPSINYIVRKLMRKANETASARIILTLLTPAKAEDLFNYLNERTDPLFNDLLWIATDSWGGRNWQNMKNSTAILNNTIAVVPKTFFDDDFKRYYIKRLPSQIDCDPWLAEQFENFCNCQYNNGSLFINLELIKIRKLKTDSVSCQKIESECALKVYKNFKQMLYIHYVIDGIYAYAYTLAKLIPNNCTNQPVKECVQYLFKSGILDIGNISLQMKNINFTDSTGENFQFWNQSHDGVPRYSIVKFDQSRDEWLQVGNITEPFKFNMDSDFEEYLEKTYNIPPCRKPCFLNEARQFNLSLCCWKCHKCLSNEIIISTTELSYLQQSCKQCGTGKVVINNTCHDAKKTFMSFNEDVAVPVIIINMIGLIMSLISVTVFIIYWKTPIIKALGRETSTIIIVATILSFVISIILLERPTKVLCYLRWCGPGICSTICYAAILTKTNRIARIFGIKLSADKKVSPRFISPISQINIVLIITSIECGILTVVMLSSSVDVTVFPNNVFNCLDFETSNLVAIFLVPSMLLIFSTVYAFKIRKTPDGFNETRNINFLNFTNCVVFITCLLLHQMLKEKEYSVIPFCILLTLGGLGNLLSLFIPKIYIILFRPNKNTLQAVVTKSRSRSQISFSQSPSISSGLDVQNPKLANVRCRKCNSLLVDEFELNTLVSNHGNNQKTRSKSKSKVNFLDISKDERRNNTTLDDSSNGSSNAATDNKTYIQDQSSFI